MERDGPFPLQVRKERRNVRAYLCRKERCIALLVQQIHIQITHAIGHAAHVGKIPLKLRRHFSREHLFDLTKRRTGAANGHPKIMQKFRINIVFDPFFIALYDV